MTASAGMPPDGSKDNGTPSYIACCRFVASQMPAIGYIPYGECITELCDYADALRAYATELETRCARLQDELNDMADNGLRFDLNPTHILGGVDCNEVEQFWHEYAKRMDESIRERAIAALKEGK